MICADQANIGSETETLHKSQVDWLHIDVMDGIFVPRLGMFPEQVAAIRRYTDKKIDAHMMVTNPEPYINVFAQAGLSLMSVHVEGNNDVNRTVKKIQASGMDAGIILNTATNESTLKWIIDNPAVKLVLLMGINPGVLNQGIWPPLYEKIEMTRAYLDSAGRQDIEIQIDGSVKKDNSADLIKAGASILVCGSSTIFRPQDGPLNDTINSFVSEIEKKLVP